MAETYKKLADGQLANAVATIYTAPGSTKCISPCICMFNTNTTTETVKLYLNSGTRRQVAQYDIPASGFASHDFGRVVLEAAYTIDAFTTTASKVDYWLSGVEIT